MRRTRLRANIVFNIVGMSLPIAVAFVTVPLYLTHIGAARYGLLSIIWVLLVYFAFADLGVARAAVNTLARLGDGAPVERHRVLATALYANALFGLGGGAIAYFGCGVLIDHVLSLPAGLRQEADAAIPWIAGLVPLTLIGAAARAAIESREKFFVVNLLELGWTVPVQILPLLTAIWIGPELPLLLPPVFAARLVALIAALCIIIRSEWGAGIFVFDTRCLREMMGFGAWVSLGDLIGPLLSTVDQWLVGSLLGPVAVAHYAVPLSMVSRSQIAVSASARALFPRFSRLPQQEARDLAERAIVSLAHALGGLCGAILLLSGPFLSFWLGADFAAQAAPVAQVLMIGAWANSLAVIPYVLLQGRRRPDLVAKTHMFELVPYALLLWPLIHWLGILGAAIGWATRAVVDALVLLRWCRLTPRLFARLLPSLALVFAAYVTAQFTVSTGWLVGACVVLLSSSVLMAAAFDPTTRGLLGELWARMGRVRRASTVSP